ncbi:probable proline--tRNA ligase, mitochondrial [Amphiura filiformis]|uniref:probable proline--tRNA ligase, mitochondrial n=1 Tax=Amphiura filiformis TaxID=82378 RepID=UPI003B212A40
MTGRQSRILLAKLLNHGNSNTTRAPPWQHCIRQVSTKRICVSNMFLPSYKCPPAKDVTKCKSLQLMLNAGLIQSAGPGTFHFLPLALRSLEKLIKLIDSTMGEIGAQKIAMPCLTKAELWKTSGRWDTMGAELFRLSDRHGGEYCLGPTHEEAITSLIGSEKSLSYKHLPLRLYQTTTKFRDEMTPKFGLLRGREFYMKDMYTFDTTEAKAMETYNAVCVAYETLFRRLGVACLKAVGDTGSIGGSVSHEYHFIAETGEDKVFHCSKCGLSKNKELIDGDKPPCPEGLSGNDCPIEHHHAIEVGHTFYLGTKYSQVFDASYVDPSGKHRTLEMGCYGLGVSRILAACIEVLSKGSEVRWPRLIAPYQVCIVPPKAGSKEEQGIQIAESLYDDISQLPGFRGEVVIDDRYDKTIGHRRKDANIIGYPYVIVVGKKALQQEHLFELHSTNIGNSNFVNMGELVQKLTTESTEL